MKASVDQDLCIGCGVCESVAPGVFYMKDDGLAGAADVELEETLLEDAREAEDQCPSGAIVLETKG